MTPSNIADPTLTLLEERFLSSGYRKDMLEDKLQCCQSESPEYVSIVDAIRNIPSVRSWIVPQQRLRIEFFPNNIQQLQHISSVRSYLRAFYADVVQDNACMVTAPPTFIVDISPQDTEWLRIVSAHQSKILE